MEKIRLCFIPVDSGTRLFLAISFSIFVSETLIMLVIQGLPPFSVLGTALLDSTLLLIVIYPILYSVMFRPLTGIITKRTRDLEVAISSLRESEARYRAVAQSANDAIVTTDTAGNIVGWNPGAERMFGYVETEVMGQPLTLLMLHSYHDRHLTGMSRVLSGRESRLIGKTVEAKGRRKDKSEFPLELSLAQWETAGGQFVTGIIRDITERKHAEAEILHYVEQLKTAIISTVEVATIISDLRDPYTAGHDRRVAGIAVAIGAELGFDANRRAGLRIAGQMHDIGKVTIAAEILSKRGELSAAESQLVQGHPQAGYEVLKGVEWPWPVPQVVLQHHERMDGSGYPQGLKSDAILLEARILAVADTIEAMSSRRTYRQGLGIEGSLAEIERGRGTLYDPDVVDACLRLFREKQYQLPA